MNNKTISYTKHYDYYEEVKKSIDSYSNRFIYCPVCEFDHNNNTHCQQPLEDIQC